jgi:hypothetical protein
MYSEHLDWLGVAGARMVEHWGSFYENQATRTRAVLGEELCDQVPSLEIDLHCGFSSPMSSPLMETITVKKIAENGWDPIDPTTGKKMSVAYLLGAYNRYRTFCNWMSARGYTDGDCEAVLTGVGLNDDLPTMEGFQTAIGFERVPQCHEYRDHKPGVFGLFKDAPKVSSYILNLHGQCQYVTKDRWFWRMIGRHLDTDFPNDNPPCNEKWLPFRMEVEQLFRRLAFKMGVMPSRCQAVFWYQERLLWWLAGRPTPGGGIASFCPPSWLPLLETEFSSPQEEV